MENTESTTVDSGTTQDGQQEYVPVNQASDEDIAAFLAGNAKPETETEPESEQAADTQVTAQSDTAEEQTKDSEEEKPEVVSKQEYDRLVAMYRQSELFNKRRSTEIGDLRKALKEANAKLEKSLEDEYVDDPKKAINTALKLKENQQKLEQLDQEDEAIQYRQKAQAVVTAHVKEEDWNLDAMTQALSTDGLPPEYITTFRTDPLSAAMPETLIQLAKRARAEQALRALVPYAKKLEEEVKKLRGAPQKVAEGIEKALRQATPTMTASPGSSADTKDIGLKNPSAMTDAEIKEFLKAKK